MNETLNTIMTSVEVAAAIQKRHDNLLRSIRTCSRHIKRVKRSFVLPNFWRESTYAGKNGEVQPCYLVTEEGWVFLKDMPRGHNKPSALSEYINHFLETN